MGFPTDSQESKQTRSCPTDGPSQLCTQLHIYVLCCVSTPSRKLGAPGKQTQLQIYLKASVFLWRTQPLKRASLIAVSFQSSLLWNPPKVAFQCLHLVTHPGYILSLCPHNAYSTCTHIHMKLQGDCMCIAALSVARQLASNPFLSAHSATQSCGGLHVSSSPE